MRIVRVLTDTGIITWAEENPDGVLRRIAGSLWESFDVTDEVVVAEQLLAPVRPPVIIGIAQNYRAHAQEMGSPLPVRPVFFMKTPTSVQDPGKPIHLPRTLRSDKVDYEAELAIVIGRTCRNATPEDTLDFVLGYTIGNDVSARDWQKEWGGGQFWRGKTFDTFCPLGPAVVTRDVLGEARNLRIRSEVNGESRQNSSTSDMVFDVATLVSFVSGSTTLPAGTVILAGTPAGVGSGFNPPRFLAAGDTVTVEIEGIGRLSNPVEEEPRDGPRPFQRRKL